jgi:hypothetical protein
MRRMREEVEAADPKAEKVSHPFLWKKNPDHETPAVLPIQSTHLFAQQLPHRRWFSLVRVGICSSRLFPR